MPNTQCKKDPLFGSANTLQGTIFDLPDAYEGQPAAESGLGAWSWKRPGAWQEISWWEIPEVEV